MLSTVFVLVGIFLITRTALAATGINEQINFQGRLLDSTGAVVADGSYNMKLRIYQDGDGALGGGDETLKWTETRESGNKVLVKNGYFSVYLGSVTAFSSSVDWNQDTLWLSVDIGGTGTPSYDGEMSPFTRLSSSPYALNSGRLGGLAATEFVKLAQGVQTDSSDSNPSIFINKTGSTANILQLQKSGTDVLVVGNNGGLTFSPQSSEDITFTLDDDSNLVINGTITSTNSQDLQSINLTNQSSSGTQRGLVITNANDAANATTESLLALDNAETTASTVTDGIIITSSGVNNGVVDAIDVSDSNITNALNIGANAIAGTNFSVTGAGAVTAVGVNAGSGSLQGSGGLSVTGSSTLATGAGDTLGLGNTTGAITITGSSSSTIVLNGTTISASEINVLDGGIDESEVTGVITAVTAGSGLTTGGTSGAVTLDVGAGNGITVNADDVAVNQAYDFAFTGNVSFTPGSTGDVAFATDADSNVQITASAGNTSAFVVTNSTSKSVVTVDTSNGKLVLGDTSASGVTGALTFNTSNNAQTVTLTSGATSSGYTLTLPTAAPGANNYCLVSSTTGALSFAACGATGGNYKVTLAPEYPGAVVTGDGSSNTGTMTGDFCSGSSLRSIPSASNPCGASEEHNYYTWVTTAQNDYDIWVRWQVPSDFSDFAASNAVQMYGWRTDSTATTEVNLSMYNASGTQCGTTTNVATGTAAWTQTSMSGTVTASGCSISAGDVIDLRIQLNANNKTVRAGEITINYQRK
jgi:hypothetical protein